MQTEMKPWIILITHGKLGAEVKGSAEMIAGELENVYSLSLMEGTDPMYLAMELKELLDKAPDDTIILTDLFGGTPSNTAARFALEKNYTVLAGLNLAMLIEAEMQRGMLKGDELEEDLMNAAKDGVRNIRKIMKETEAECIAVGHHENDNTETMLLNMVRGTGIKGMCGMQPKNNDVVRPLLCLTRKDIIDYLDEHRQGYVTDHTNLEDEYARNKVRLDIMPILEQINRGAAGNMASTMENLNEVYKVYRHAIKRDIAFCAHVADNGETRIDISKLKETASPISVLHELIGDRGFNKAELKDMLACGCGKVFGKKGSRVVIDRTCIITEAPHYPVPVIEKRIVDVADMKIERDGLHAYLDADKLHDQLTMRTPKAGDSFAPFGMKGKRKLLSDYMTDQKMSLFEKERQPLLMDGEEIAWVVGRRSSELYKVDGKTKRVVILYLKSWQK